MKAVWKNKTLAESSKTQLVEGYQYFPPESVKFNCLQASDHKTTSWIGEATYYNVVLGAEVLPNGAWTYANPAPSAAKIKDHVAFVRSVQVS
jgi:uncharacterized protein (DUF427 family)